MKKIRFILLLIALVLAVVWCVSAAADDGIQDAEIALDRLLNTPYYALDSLQNINADEYMIAAVSGDPVEFMYLSGERATSGSVDFVSGDDWMQDKAMWINNFNPGEHAVALSANGFDQPGEAVFHVTVQSQNHSIENDYTLRVIPFPENPVELKEDGKIMITPGATYTAQDLVDMICSLAPELQGSEIRRLTFHSTENGEDIWLSTDIIGEYYLYETKELTGVLGFEIANAQFAFFDVKVGPLPYTISGPNKIYPGMDVNYTVRPVAEGAEVPDDFVLTAEGAEIDAEGNLTLGENAKVGDKVTLTASSEQAGITCTMTVEITENPTTAIIWTDTEVGNVTLPMATVEKGEVNGPTDQGGNEYTVSWYNGNFSGQLGDADCWLYGFYDIMETAESSDTFQNLIRNVSDREQNWIRQEYEGIRRFYINGYPVICGIKNAEQGGGGKDRTVELEGRIGKYQIGMGIMISCSAEGTMPPFGMELLTDVLGRIKIDGQPVEIMDHEPVPALIQTEGITEISSGANVQYSAGEADPTFGAVIWEITDENGEPTKAATVDKDGLVKTNKGLKSPEKVKIKARYEYCTETGSTELTIYPVVKKITVQASDSFLYLDGNHSVTLTAVAEPEGAKLIGLTWSMNKEGFAELKDNGDGTATLTPVAGGAVVVTATDASKKKGTAKITVTDQVVTAVEITAKGAAAPGKTVKLAAALTPARPARKDVEWSIDVDESIAVINAKGQLKIAKDAPSGTTITVTCTALGAAQPVKATLTLTVE